MKNKIFKIIYLLLFIIIGGLYASGYHDIFILPFTFIGRTIRTVLFSEGPIHVLALVIFMAISLSPMVYLLFRIKKHKALSWEIIILSIISIFTIFTIYYFTNPKLVNKVVYGPQFKSNYISLHIAVTSIFYCLIFLYVGLRLISSSNNKTSNKITKVMIYGLIGLITFKILAQSANSLISAFTNLNIQITEGIFIIVNYLYQASISIAAIYLLLKLQKSFLKINDGTLSSTSLSETKRLNKLSKIFITLIIGIPMILLTPQFIIFESLDKIPLLITPPIFELIVFIITLFVTTYIIKTNKNINNNNNIS